MSAAGMWQVVEDHLHRDVLELARASKAGGLLPAAAGRPLAAGLRATAAAARALRGHSSGERRSADLAVELASLVAKLGERVTGDAGCHDDGWRRVELAAERVAAVVGRVPLALRRAVAIPPRSFFSFDQRPEDCRRLVSAFAERWPDRDLPLLVVGVRTSGSYLAPLCAAFLRRLGYSRVAQLTWRRGQAVLAAERRAVAPLVAAGGRALIVDDPPTSGGSVARVAGDLQRLGLAADSVVFLLPLFDSPGWWRWPQRLEGRHLVLLPWMRWAVHDQLAPEAVAASLQQLLAGRIITLAGAERLGPRVEVAAVTGAERLPLTPTSVSIAGRSARDHARALFRASVRDAAGSSHQHYVYVKGVGLGFFAEQGEAIASRLEGFVPETYGVRDGLLYRAWISETWRLSGLDSGPDTALVRQVTAYVARRRRALAVEEDVAHRVRGHETLWKSCSTWAGGAFGRLARPLGPVLDRSSRRFLLADDPCLIDGGMRLSDWFAPKAPPGESAAPIIKVGYDNRIFRYQIPFCYDAAYDLACLAAEHLRPEFSEQLRAEYFRLTGERVGDERWFLYRLLHLLEYRHRLAASYQADLGELRGLLPGDRMASGSRYRLAQALGEAERALSQIHDRYLGDAYLSDLEPGAAGPLCAIDVDGVLETTGLSYAGITPAGALALRALARHGFRPVLASGRSLQEVRERCASYRLAGGVAEYGGAIYDHRRDRAQGVLSAAQQADLDRLRRELAADPDVIVDHHYRHCVRAYQLVGARSRGLEPEMAEAALTRARLEGRVRVIRGWAQTDFAPEGVDKGTGLHVLAAALDEPEQRDGRFLALAVGDSASDLSMFARARLACAPASADRQVRAAGGTVAVMSQPYQRGLLAAARLLLAHHPGRCQTCAPPRLEGDRERLIAMLAAQDRTKLGKLAQALRLALAR